VEGFLPFFEDADDAVRAQMLGQVGPLVQLGRGLVIQDDDHAVLLGLVEEFRCVKRTLAGSAAAAPVHSDTHHDHPSHVAGSQWTP
jgi:hypothetical protein